MIREKIEKLIKSSYQELSLGEFDFVVEHPTEISHGDYSTNVALVVSKEKKSNPKETAQEIADEISKKLPKEIESVEVAGPGFINFKLNKDFFLSSIKEILKEGDSYGKNKNLSGQKIVVEYTDPNPFKEFHIGHTMSNAIGEAISRIIEWNGAEVKRACYSGDKGIHVARAVAYKLKTKADWFSEKDVADSYTKGSRLYEEDEEFKKFTVEVNKKIYEETDPEINQIYMVGRTLTLEYFESIYRKLGTKFDFYFYESETGEFGIKVVKENTPKIFEESDGAVVYRGEKRNKKLHTRVFVNKEGIPTYEAKELGLAKIKYDLYPYDSSIVITGNEVSSYFEVLLSALSEIFPDLAKKTHHIGHGMLRLPTGKMSSRTGDVITAETVLESLSEKIKEKMSSTDKANAQDGGLVSSIAVGAIKYSMLKQSIGKDSIFDMDSATSFEGDSGPYLQYTNARINSILNKAKEEGIKAEVLNEEVSELEKRIVRFPEIVDEAYRNLSPQLLVSFLVQIAGLFNSYYAQNQIVDSKNMSLSAHRVALAQAVGQILKNGLYILGIRAPDRM